VEASGVLARRKLPAGTDPLAVWRALRKDPGRVALDSLAEGPGTGRWSIVASRPLARVVWRDGSIEVVAANGMTLHAVPGVDPFVAIREVLAWFGAGTQPDFEGLPFAGGAVGWLSYELGRRMLPAKFPAPRADADPPVELALFGGAIVIDRASGEGWAVGVDTALGRGEDEASRLAAAVAGSAERTLESARPAEAGLWSADDAPPPWEGDAAHRRAVAEIRRYIEAGDVYQANVSSRFEAACEKTPDQLWQRLRETSPEPFAACIEGVDRVVFSASMERLLSVRGRDVETRPIKGTRARGGSPQDDERLRRELATSEKDSAELLMIVDIHRNDLGKVCRPGSVQVPTLFGVRTFARVHHLEATITGSLRDGMDALDALRAVFPAGSITGAPKIRAMQVLEEVEPQPRGVYCGAIGYLGLDGSADFAVAIRTAVLRDGRLRWSAGGGIVWDSDPVEEWREVLAKSAGFRALIA
jgi:para-aminobenzoate synthetase component I